MDRRRELGAWGEELAARHLRDMGLEVVERNWRCRWGEIDILARDGRMLVVCEVKTRTSTDFGTPLSAVTPVKVRRLRRLAAEWIAAREARPSYVRFDVIGITSNRSGEGVVIEHVRGVS